MIFYHGVGHVSIQNHPLSRAFPTSWKSELSYGIPIGPYCGDVNSGSVLKGVVCQLGMHLNLGIDVFVCGNSLVAVSDV